MHRRVVGRAALNLCHFQSRRNQRAQRGVAAGEVIAVVGVADEQDGIGRRLAVVADDLRHQTRSLYRVAHGQPPDGHIRHAVVIEVHEPIVRSRLDE